MSAFLGPIHYWLYNKIQLQENLVDAILTIAKKNDWQAITSERLDAACGAAERRALDIVIDGGNIHGWLQSRIAVAEARLALAVTTLLKEDASRIHLLAAVAYEFGQQHSIGKSLDVSEVFQALTDSLIDGMPCDHVNQILRQDQDTIVWEQTRCLHNEHWTKVGGDISVYYTLRTKMIAGMLAESGLTFHSDENQQFSISRGAIH